MLHYNVGQTTNQVQNIPNIESLNNIGNVTNQKVKEQQEITSMFQAITQNKEEVEIIDIIDEEEKKVVIEPIKEVKINQTNKSNLLITNNPKSSFSEAIKSIRTNLQFASVDKEIKVILVTSPEPGDGKSSISSNLAGAYAQDNKKVLIIDCDLRKGRQDKIFKTKKQVTTGYTNLILNYNGLESFNINSYIVKTGIENIDLIETGPTPPNPIELLSSDKNKYLLAKLKNMYDIIILDCPPVLGLNDTLIMTKYSDANIVIVSKGKTKVESLSEVKKSFEKANTTITGVVINKDKQKHSSYYGYYGEH